MRRSLFWIVGVLCIVGFVSVGHFLPSSKKEERKPVIKVGYVAPLTGNVAYLGDGVKKAAELALKDLQAKDTNYEYQVVFEDDAFDPKRTASAINKLIHVDHVDALVTVASAAGNVASPIAEAAQVIHFGIASDPVIAKGEYNFINWTPPQEEAKTFIAELHKRNLKKIAIFGQQISGITAEIDELKKQIVGTDIQVVFEDVSAFGTKDFRTAIAKAQASNPDVITLLMFSPELEVVTRQMREMNVTTPITAIESFELSDHPEMFEGLWYVNAADPSPRFAEAYQNAYGRGPSVATPNAYDILGLIAHAAESMDGKTKPLTKDLANALLRMQGYQGALGDNLSINSDGLVVSQAVTRIIKNGKPETVK